MSGDPGGRSRRRSSTASVNPAVLEMAHAHQSQAQAHPDDADAVHRGPARGPAPRPANVHGHPPVGPSNPQPSDRGRPNLHALSPAAVRLSPTDPPTATT